MYIVKKNNDDKWIIIKEGNKRATKVFESKAEAVAYAEKKYKDDYKIEDEFEVVRKVHKKWPKVFWTLAVLLLIAVIVLGVLFLTGKIKLDKGEGELNPTPTEPVDPNASIVENVKLDGLEIHFMEFGNAANGDATYIKAGDTDILIDAGSQSSSATHLIEYINQYCTDGKLEYVITTHGDTDHISGMYGLKQNGLNSKGEAITNTGILYYYEVGTIIDFARTGKEDGQNVTKYRSAVDYAVSKGAKHYNARQCWNEEDGALRSYTLANVGGNDITMDILFNKYYFNDDAEIKGNKGYTPGVTKPIDPKYKTSDENEYSVVTMFNYGSKHYLLTGDLEVHGEESLAAYYDGSTPEKTLPEVDLFKAGHHGSPTSSNDVLLDIIKPKISVVSCSAGAIEYTNNNDNVFPSQAFINRIAKHTDRVYVTTMVDYKESIKTGDDVFKSLNGTVIVSSNGSQIGLWASNNLTKLKDSDWFNEEVYMVDGKVADKKKGDLFTDKTPNAILKPRRIWPS